MGIEVYNQQNAVSDDPYVLVLKLYEGVIKYLSFVKSAMQDGNIESKFTYINKSIRQFFFHHLLKRILHKIDCIQTLIEWMNTSPEL